MNLLITAALMLTLAMPALAQTPTPQPAQTPTPQPATPPQASSQPQQYCDEFGCTTGTLVPKGLIYAVDAEAAPTPTPSGGLAYTCTVYSSPDDADAYLDTLPPAQRKCFSWYVPNITGPDGVGNYFFLSCPTGGDSSPFCAAAGATPTPTPTPAG